MKFEPLTRKTKQLIIEAIPATYFKTHQELVDEGKVLLGINAVPGDPTERERLIDEIGKLLKRAPYPEGQPDAELVRGRYLSAVGIIYGLILAEQFGWEMCWLRDADEEIEDGVKSIINPDRSYFLAPIGVASKEMYHQQGETLAVYEKIKSGNLPDVPPGSFHEIKP